MTSMKFDGSGSTPIQPQSERSNGSSGFASRANISPKLNRRISSSIPIAARFSRTISACSMHAATLHA